MPTAKTQIPPPPLFLSREKVVEFINPYLKNKGVYLDIAKAFGSPLYVLETDVLARKAEQFRAAFSHRLPETAFFYAMKSNNLPHLSGHLLKHGFGLDVSSGVELSVALELGASSIIFSGPGKTIQELALAAQHPDRVLILLDSIGEAKRLTSVLEKKQTRMPVGLRLNNNPEGLWRKFGVLPEHLLSAFKEIETLGRLDFQGLQFHSSWNLNPDRQTAFIKKLGEILSSMPKQFLDAVKFIDIGGGYWPAQGEWLVSNMPQNYIIDPGVSIDLFAKELSSAIKAHILPLTQCRICFEPGRWICNDAMHILIQVVDCKEKDLVITDAGGNTVGWERYETDYCPVLNLTRPSLSEKKCHILGSLCTPHDVWGYGYFGSGIKENDILMIPAQGAYTYSLRQQFIKPIPRVAVKESSNRYFLLLE
ncbi:diaminopimelate decarboxylase family protein [Desulfobacter sp. UBA2225]|uniref:diaminopimelate decarboxylase family protein n=1 Tax=Desulfobacter sp. UBA2225 TaxID=1961413 RepID=UPI00257F3BD9|nr:alanine racemase [Desulfobacter sp. UBA2225]